VYELHLQLAVDAAEPAKEHVLCLVERAYTRAVITLPVLSDVSESRQLTRQSLLNRVDQVVRESRVSELLRAR